MKLKEVTRFVPSSWHGTFINTTPQSLIDLAEKWNIPYEDNNDGSDKTNFDFEFQTSDGVQFTVYDWKEYKELELGRKYRFHIGGENINRTVEARNVLTKLLNL